MPDDYSGHTEPHISDPKAFLEACYGTREKADAAYYNGPAAVHALILEVIDRADKMYREMNV